MPFAKWIFCQPAWRLQESESEFERFHWGDRQMNHERTNLMIQIFHWEDLGLHRSQPSSVHCDASLHRIRKNSLNAGVGCTLNMFENSVSLARQSSRSACLFAYRQWTDRQTDRQTEGASNMRRKIEILKRLVFLIIESLMSTKLLISLNSISRFSTLAQFIPIGISFLPRFSVFLLSSSVPFSNASAPFLNVNMIESQISTFYPWMGHLRAHHLNFAPYPLNGILST